MEDQDPEAQNAIRNAVARAPVQVSEVKDKYVWLGFICLCGCCFAIPPSHCFLTLFVVVFSTFSQILVSKNSSKIVLL